MKRYLPAAFALLFASSAWSQEVSRSALERIRSADANRDGVVTRTEFTTYRSAQFQRLDRNGDGFLSTADAPRFAVRAAGLDIESMTGQFDQNNDNRVSQAEFESGPTPAFNRADENHDGRVTDAELRTAIAAAR